MNKKKPDFVIAGAQKGGTTSLHFQLNSHPGVFFPKKPQELHFFDVDRNYKKGIPWYEKHFAKAGKSQVIGQTSPLYIYDERVPSRLHDALPDIKIIIILRDPVSRAYSHYWLAVRYGFEQKTFEEALKLEAQRLQKSYDSRRRYSYVDRGFYFSQIKRYLDFFSRDQLFITTTDQFKKHEKRVLLELCNFLSLDFNQYIPPNHSVYNPARLPRSKELQRFTSLIRPYAPNVIKLIDKINLKKTSYPKMNTETKESLWPLFKDDMTLLEKEIGIDLSDWWCKYETNKELVPNV